MLLWDFVVGRFHSTHVDYPVYLVVAFDAHLLSGSILHTYLVTTLLEGR